MLFDDEDEPIELPVNALEYLLYRGIPPATAAQIVTHLLLTQTFAVEDDILQAARDMGVDLPMLVPGSDTVH